MDECFEKTRFNMLGKGAYFCRSGGKDVHVYRKTDGRSAIRVDSGSLDAIGFCDSEPVIELLIHNIQKALR